MRKESLAELIRKRSNIFALIMCLMGVVINMALNSLVSALDLPLYLDTVGTVLVAALGGYLPGIIVGFFTNVVKALSNPASLYYGLVNIFIAFITPAFFSKGWHKKISGIIGMILIFTLIGGGLGALIPWLIEDMSFDGEAVSSVIYETLHVSRGAAQFSASLIRDLPDKAITVLLVLAAVRLIPESSRHLIRFSMWLQRPVAEDEAAHIGQSSVRVMSLRKKTLLVLGLSMATVAVAASSASLIIYTDALIDGHIRIAQGTARIAAGELDGDNIDDYLKSGGDTEEYRRLERELRNILVSTTDIKYLYVYKILDDGCHVIFDLDETGEKPGAVIPFDEGFSEYIPDLLAGRAVDPIITNDRYGHLLTVYEPVYDSDGRCACYVGVDVDVGKLAVMRRSFIAKSASIFLGFFVLLCTFVIWLLDYQLIIPINTVARGMNELTHASASQERMDEDVKMFRSLNIHTGDELENLYHSAGSMTRNQAEHLRSIRRLSDSTAKMQDGLIITMADLVESRDSDTGAHVQKTAAYVKIIVEGLKKKGYYLQKITPKFMSDVVRSAPLHDVGKINIPDEVLNKPGKLTDEEYEIMKTHTTAGKRIMENAISTVEGDNYLKEARNMAAYHHERWDGKGYPEGIHGEVIPLSARIMAVADVFDALTSPRVYKPAFPLEKALAILEEGKGTQFDPKCVEVFMDALPEVKVILKKYNKDM
ncbi:MAG: HD domain-containing protein [Lachnospiraceae bacterium]|nr:HD domain-containing protein [Lachnospiraceae bacterium]